MGNWALKTAVNVLYHQHWTELAYGYAAMWTDILEPLDIRQIDEVGVAPAKLGYGHGFEIETLLFCRAVRTGLRVVEIPGVEFDRIFGDTHLNTFRDGWRALHALYIERFGVQRSVDLNEQHPRPPVIARIQLPDKRMAS
jgi:hypothetical protein